MRALRFFKVFWQSLFLQANWNFERMQNLGFLTAILPSLSRMTKDQAEQKTICRRHLQYFNTQPYFASLIIGSTIRLEMERIEKGESEAKHIEKAKMDMMGPFAAMGDSLFWGTMKPFTGFVAVLLIMVNQIVWAPLLFLFLYNVPHLFTRWWGLKKGYEQQFGIVQTVFNLRCQTLIKTIKMMGLILLGGSLPVFAQQVSWSTPAYVDFNLLLLIFTLMVLAISLLLRRGVAPHWVLAMLLLGSFFLF